MKITAEEILGSFPATVYRFRSDNALSLKELLYGEIFFSTKDELNDPYDTKNPHFFESDIEIYQRLLKHALHQWPGNGIVDAYTKWANTMDVDMVARFLCNKDLLFDELIEVVNSRDFQWVVQRAFDPLGIVEAITASGNFIQHFINLLYKRGGGRCYIVAFSMNNTNPVMWSHYANNHKGFCLCFSITDRVFKASQLSMSKESGREYRHENEYRFEEVTYAARNNSIINGFYQYPMPVFGRDISKEERELFWATRKQSYLTKYKSWEYEKEVRLLQDDWFHFSVTAEGIKKRNLIDRIFYYDQKQLTGLIFGSKMDESTKEDIKQIVIANRHETQREHSDDCLPLFVFFEAKESSFDFEMDIHPLTGLSTTNDAFFMSDYQKKKEEYEALKQHYERMRARKASIPPKTHP